MLEIGLMKMKETDYSSYNENKKYFLCAFSNLNIMIMHLSCLLEAEDIMDLQEVFSQVDMCVSRSIWQIYLLKKERTINSFN